MPEGNMERGRERAKAGGRGDPVREGCGSLHLTVIDDRTTFIRSVPTTSRAYPGHWHRSHLHVGLRADLKYRERMLRLPDETAVLRKLTDWGGNNESIRAMVLTSSRTRPGAPVDPLSDYDVMLFVTDVDRYANQ